MRFSSIPSHLVEGFRAIKVIELPITTQPHGLQAETPEQAQARDGRPTEKIMVGLRALMPVEREEVLSNAYARAVSKGASGEVEASAVYQHALAIYTVAMACVDPESDRSRPVLFFGDSLEGAAEALRSSPLMSDDIVYYLRERQEAWQDEIHPQALTLRDDEIHQTAAKVVEDADFLWRMRPGMRVQFTRTLAALCVSLAGDSFISSSKPTASTTKPSTKPSKRNAKANRNAKRVRKGR